MKAYDTLKPIIGQEGEFVPVIYENDEAFVFNPFNVAEEIDALDEGNTRNDKWGDLESLAFHEDKLKDWTIFRARFNAYTTVQITDAVKAAIEKDDL